MTTLHYTLGLPASGKTTFAREFVTKNPNTVRANLDDLRLLLHGPQAKFNKNRERAAVLAQNGIIRAALSDGRDVICDDTNLNPAARQRLVDLAAEFKADLRCHDFTDVPLSEVIRRDAARGQAGNRSVGEDVIRGMYERWLCPDPLPLTGKPECVCVDIDGTLAQMSGRGPFEWERVGDDLPNRMVIHFTQTVGIPVVVMSGRDGVCRPQTVAWLKEHGIPFVELLMRTADDNRPDHVIKNELLDDLLTRWYPVLAVDDRQQVVDNVWRARGIECWQVASGRF